MSANVPPAKRSKAASTKKTASKRSKSAAVPAEDLVCSEPGCAKVCRSASGLASHRRFAHPSSAAPSIPETPSAAVERVLFDLDITPRRAVLAATVRELARALELCEPTDKAKTSKELTARMADLLADTATAGDGSDWTEDDDE
jgi:hypothetical protein